MPFLNCPSRRLLIALLPLLRCFKDIVRYFSCLTIRSWGAWHGVPINILMVSLLS
jgi:hypothetical protein